MDRIERIKATLQEGLAKEFASEYSPSDVSNANVSYLLERINELERDNRRLRKQLEASHLDYLSTQE